MSPLENQTDSESSIFLFLHRFAKVRPVRRGFGLAIFCGVLHFRDNCMEALSK
jgi:hypothetical protein